MLKKLLSIILAVIMLLSLCACGCKHTYDRTTGKCTACGETCAHQWNALRGTCDTCKMTCAHEIGISEVKPCSTCGFKFETYKTTDLVGMETDFFRLPGYFETQDCPEPGTLEKVYYTADSYSSGETYDKYVLVYLPYGYDQNDTSKKYNVVYFQHGNNSTIDIIFSAKALKMFDNIFYYTDIEPVIFVNTSFYSVIDDPTSKATDGWTDGGDFEFHKEILQDIVPLVESKYNTYTTSFDDEGLKASRDHRAFTGYSRGGRCTWNMFINAFEYFKWWSPMSGGVSFEGSTQVAMEAFERVKETIDAHPGLDFFLFPASGGTNDRPEYIEQMAYFMKQTDYFSIGKDPSKNNFYYSIADYAHGDPCSPFYFYNSLQVFFK
ncbi:MAG: hypothetical protein IKA39_05845 [Clostridia bacterium]|nr:hypothetical protein [Clostridia bacterium]